MGLIEKCSRYTRAREVQASGFYPYFGSVYSGGGFTLGAGFREYYGGRTHWDIKGMYSIKSYKFLEASTDSWGHAHGRVDLHARVPPSDASRLLRTRHGHRARR